MAEKTVQLNDRTVLSRSTLEEWAEKTLEMIVGNFRTQQIFPFEVYPGYLAKNARSKGWKSTGAGVRSVYFRVAEYADFSNVKIAFFFNDYLRYVDMGVGAGFPYSKVETRDREVERGTRHHNWNKAGDRGERPILKSVINTRKRVLEWMIRTYCQDEFTVLMYRGMDDAFELLDGPLMEL